MISEIPNIIWWFLIPLGIWELIWKGISLWRCGRNNQLNWFIAILALNTMGILPIVYLKFYQKKG
jgi:methionyl-tRNA synthetase